MFKQLDADFHLGVSLRLTSKSQFGRREKSHSRTPAKINVMRIRVTNLSPLPFRGWNIATLRKLGGIITSIL